jgi:hypothetical protein
VGLGEENGASAVGSGANDDEADDVGWQNNLQACKNEDEQGMQRNVHWNQQILKDAKQASANLMKDLKKALRKGTAACVSPPHLSFIAY